LPVHQVDTKPAPRVTSFQFTVYGIPAPQGSKRFVGLSKRGRGILIESSTKVRPWRVAVVCAAREAIERAGLAWGPGGAVRGPIALAVGFTLPRPASAPKKRKWPDRKPDLSKLVRSTEDALSDAGAWGDDARVVTLMAVKRYVGDPKAMSSPGAVINILEAA